jgi:hypothetical protein
MDRFLLIVLSILDIAVLGYIFMVGWFVPIIMFDAPGSTNDPALVLISLAFRFAPLGAVFFLGLAWFFAWQDMWTVSLIAAAIPQLILLGLATWHS